MPQASLYGKSYSIIFAPANKAAFLWQGWDLDQTKILSPIPQQVKTDAIIPLVEPLV